MSNRALIAVSALWVALLSAALALSLLAASHDTLPGDTDITEWLQDRPLPGQDLSDVVRAVSGTEVVLATGAAVSLVLWLRGHRRQAVLLVLGLSVLSILQFAVKEAVDRPRPSSELVAIRAGYSSASFPSGHVMSATFLYGFLVYLSLTLPLPPKPAIVLAAASAAIIAAVSPVNVWLGVHWPSDALGGCLWVGVILLPLIILERLRASG
jgi:undecaprenyl-diphosphatase